MNDLRSTVGWRLCRHARAAAAQRGFTTTDVLEVIANPEVTYTQYNHAPGRHIMQRGRLGIVVDPDARIVVTVLHRQLEQWHDQAAGS